VFSIAKGKITKQSTTLGPLVSDNAVDGKPETYSSTLEEAWGPYWSVNLGAAYSICGVIVEFVKSETAPTHVTLGNSCTPDETSVACEVTLAPDYNYLIATCPPTPYQHVHVIRAAGNAKLELRDVYVFPVTEEVCQAV
jgi:hypothetical protein